MASESLTIFGDYLLLERVGMGGMAEVFRAQRRTRRPGESDLALKRLLPNIAEDPTLSRLYLREVEALRRIDHPVVVRMVDAGELHGLPYVVMPWLGGHSLRQIMSMGEGVPQRPLPVAVALWLAAELADGLHAAHQMGVVHRDVSPSNVLITDAGDVRLIDFGIARVAGLAQTTHGQSWRGKWAYATPEQIAGQPVDARTDVFALASVTVECLLGQAPFADTDRQSTLARIQVAEPARWPQNLDREVDELLRQMVQHDPTGRPPDAAAVAARLRQWLSAQPVDPAMPQWCTQQLRGRVLAVPRPASRAAITSAELRGEDVTKPEQDRDATEVRIT